MTGVVLDASAALAWCFPDERDVAGERVLDELVEAAVLVPGHWFAEVTNGVASGLRRGRVTSEEARSFARLLERWTYAFPRASSWSACCSTRRKRIG